MKIDRKEIPIRDIVAGYEEGEGVTGYGGRLDIRPPYQREFIHENNPEFQKNLIQSIYQKRPISLIYFARKGPDAYELLDGQQRIITICRYVEKNRFSAQIDGDLLTFRNLDDQQRARILDYELMLYICEGNPSELMKWFQTINTGAQELTNQEIRNAIYNGPWVTDAKRYFTKTGAPADRCGRYMTGKRERQEHLERIIQWITGSRKDDDIRQYMADRQGNPDALPLWQYFESLDAWISRLFDRDKSMKGVDWGDLYTEYSKNEYDPMYMKSRQDTLLKDDEVTNDKGVYEYILSGETKESLLNLRKFPDRIRKKFYKKQDGKCAYCLKEIKLYQAHADHITPWSAGGKTEEDNCQILCRDCNLSKSNKQ